MEKIRILALTKRIEEIFEKEGLRKKFVLYIRLRRSWVMYL